LIAVELGLFGGEFDDTRQIGEEGAAPKKGHCRINGHRYRSAFDRDVSVCLGERADSPERDMKFAACA
jgi:hypothetical protein